MRFLIAAYVVALVTLVAYGANLSRERRALHRQLGQNRR
jgi:hypothetical protein